MIAQTFSEIAKFNPYHGPDGRFTSGGGAGPAIATTAAQQYTSADTSINSSKLPAVFNKVNWQQGTTNFDNGGGKFDNATDYLKTKGVKNLIYDPFNRTKEHNQSVVDQIARQKADTATISNVLNVIQEKEARLEVLRNTKSALKPGGTAYITIYEGNGSGIGKPSSKGYQLNMKTRDYVNEVREVFPDAHISRGMIVASNGADGKSFSQVIHRQQQTAKSFTEIEKFNPYHGPDGRFTTAGAGTSFTFRTRSKLSQGAADAAAGREKERMAGIMPTEAQSKTLRGIESRTRNLKKEQFRVVDRDGNVVMQKQGDANSVTYKVGEARDNFPGNITIHNHPSGGTFSSADLSDIGYGATEIRAAAPEGTYILRNVNQRSQKSWFDMREDIDNASIDFKEGFKLRSEVRSNLQPEYEKQVKPFIDKWKKAQESGASQEELRKLANDPAYLKADANFKAKVETETRKAYTDQYHSWYKSHAGEYGLEYEFIPVKGRARKSYPMVIDSGIEKSGDEVVLDGKMQQDILDITEEIMNDFKQGTGMIPAEIV